MQSQAYADKFSFDRSDELAKEVRPCGPCLQKINRLTLTGAFNRQVSEVEI